METMNASAYIPIDESRGFALLFGKLRKLSKIAIKVSAMTHKGLFALQG